MLNLQKFTFKEDICYARYFRGSGIVIEVSGECEEMLRNVPYLLREVGEDICYVIRKRNLEFSVKIIFW